METAQSYSIRSFSASLTDTKCVFQVTLILP